MREYRRILAVVDLNEAGRAVAERALALSQLGRCELVLLHLIEPDVGLDGGYPAPSRAVARQGYETEGLRRLQFFAASLGAGEAKLQARYGQPRSAFADCAAAWQPDLVVAAYDPGYLGGRHDLLTLGQAKRSVGGHLLRLLQHLFAPAPYRNAGAGR